MAFDLNESVEVDRNDDGVVDQLRHRHEPYTAGAAGLDTPSAAELAAEYVIDVADHYQLNRAELAGLADEVSGALAAANAPQGLVQLNHVADKEMMETTVVSYQQTYRGLPVWESTMRVVVSGPEPGVTGSSSEVHRNVDVANPDAADAASLAEPASIEDALGVTFAGSGSFSSNGTRLLVYRYDPEERTDGAIAAAASSGNSGNDTDHGAGGFPAPGGANPSVAGDAGAIPARSGDVFSGSDDASGPGAFPDGAATGQADSSLAPADSPTTDPTTEFEPPTIPLPPVPADIEPGRHYVVVEVLFTLPLDGWGDLNWRAFVEPNTQAVLYLRALTASATGCVYVTDPVSTSGNPLTATSPDADLDATRTCGLNLPRLDPVVGGSQALAGKWTVVRDITSPSIAPPTESSPFDFSYGSKTADFAAVNAYYNHDAMYQMVEDLGFNVLTYFDGTTFPVPVDHRGKNNAVNASANGNTSGNGMGMFLYGLVQSGQQVGIAASARVCLHEFGHALLWDHVSSPNFGFCHSAGDTLAAILHAPTSNAPDPTQTFPFVTGSTPGIQRIHERDTAQGWAWGGTRDDRQYGSEQILSTLMFRIYRASGGDDAASLANRQFAADYLTYLIVRAIGTLTSTTRDPRVFVNALRDADEQTIDFNGHPGGAWHKMIRWNFEQQGLYQPPGAPSPVTGPGAPPAVDVYVDDGRSGGYFPTLVDIGSTSDLWNRRAADGGATNQQPLLGQANNAYVRVRNRGTATANNVEVSLYQGPGSNSTWPTDWSAATTAKINVASIAAGGSVVVGPFTWTPTGAANSSLLISASHSADTSNADTVNGAIPVSRLVPHDNNLALRDLSAAGGGGICLHVGQGSTTQGSTNWQAYGSNTGVYVDVDTSSAGFSSTPVYVTSLGGRSSHWATTGGSAIYVPTPTGFRIYVRWAQGGSITPAQANSNGWHVNWLGVVDE